MGQSQAAQLLDDIVGLMEGGKSHWLREATRLAKTQEMISSETLLTRLSDRRDVYAVTDAQGKLFELGGALLQPEGWLVGRVLQHACVRIQSFQDRGTTRDLEVGQKTVAWLIEHKALATREDMGDTYNRNFLEVLAKIWRTDMYLGLNQNPEWAREWVGEMIDQVMGSPEALEQVPEFGHILHQAANPGFPGNIHNTGLFLALLDRGAPWEGVMKDPLIKDTYKDLVRTHPLVVRTALEKVVAHLPPERAKPRRGM